ncbi:MAG: hydroxymethylglutaryl-CoA reductase, degradative [Chloroflexota bacterium]
MTEKSSRIPGFYKLPLEERVEVVGDWAGLTEEERQILAGTGLQPSQADHMIENVVGTFELPLGIAVNFKVNGKDYLVPMAVEEPSVVAAISNSAKAVRAGGGFTCEASDPIMIGQIQVLDIPDMEAALAALEGEREALMAMADSCDPVIVGLGGGARDVQFRVFPESSVGPMLIFHLLFDVRDAMGANTINTALESMAPRIAELTGGRTALRILSNLADRRTVTGRCTIPAGALKTYDMEGSQVARLIEEANAFAVVDPYRAATHNKGIMNGIDAVCIATGNDWRAIEAGAHSYAVKDGHYTALTDWHVDENGDLYGEITLPLAVGIVGGATRVHPTARTALKIMDVGSARELAEVLAAVGLAQNLAAIRALSTVGIQHGHMQLHARQVALAAGASDEQVEAITAQMVAEKRVHITRAQEILEEMES